MSWPAPVTLESEYAVLVPLSPDHANELAAVSQEDELWRLWYTSVPEPDGMADEIQRRLRLQAEGRMLPFAVLHPADQRPVGMTSYMNIDAANRRVEIGSTWYAKRVQRTGLNTSCKLMLLTHAFETLGCIAVEFRTHWFNHASRRAIERLGAKLDGVLRHHMRLPDGSLRDTCVYSIVAPEWPSVRNHLEWQLIKRSGQA